MHLFLLTDGCNFLLVNRGLQLEHEHIKVITLCYSCFWILDYLLSLFRYYNSLPPISKAYGTLCFFATVLCQLQILNPPFLALYYPFVFKKFQVSICLYIVCSVIYQYSLLLPLVFAPEFFKNTLGLRICLSTPFPSQTLTDT